MMAAGTTLQGSSAGLRRVVLGLSFVESFATILLERAVYFFSQQRLGYSETENLMLALLFGAAYTLGAARSHWLSQHLPFARLRVISGAGHAPFLSHQAQFTEALVQFLEPPTVKAGSWT